MWESLILGVERFLHAADALYGEGDQTADPPEFAVPSRLPPFVGAGAALSEAIESDERLRHRLDDLCDREMHVGRLITSACDSIASGRKGVQEERATFDSGVRALGPVANSPFGILALLPLALGAVSSVTGQIQGTSGQMADLSEEFPGAYGDDEDGDSVFLASNSQRSGALGPVFDFLESVSGLPYLWGGFSPTYGFDCSGLVSAVANMLAGLDPLAERTSTSGMGPFLAARGARHGPGGVGTVEVGWKDGPQYAGGGHTAGTVILADGRSINFEAGGNGVQFGGPAIGAREFGNIMHFELA